VKEIEIYQCTRIGTDVKGRSEKILIIGGHGNIGEAIVDDFIKDYSKVVVTGSTSTKELLESNEKFQLVINAANRYFPEPTQRQVNEMEQSIVGLAESIKNYSISHNTPVIYFSTYLQYAPKNLQPWSEYSQFKSIAAKFFKDISVSGSIPTTEIILYDNYGGKRRNKIFDLMLQAAIKEENLATNPGYSVVNLTHVNDIVRGIRESAIEILSPKSKVVRSYQFKSAKSYTLRELELMISKTLNINKFVNWGAVKYRSKEVFELWDCAESPRFWSETESLAKYVLHMRRNSPC
jgi:nucleoside-diphosphate-sugar epimerase